MHAIYKRGKREINFKFNTKHSKTLATKPEQVTTSNTNNTTNPPKGSLPQKHTSTNTATPNHIGNVATTPNNNNNTPIETNNNTNPNKQQQTSQKNHLTPTPIIIDNIKTTLNKQQIERTLREIFPDIKLSIQHLKKGGIVITPEPTTENDHHINKILLKSNYPKEVFGKNIYIHLAGKDDLRPWLCINKIPIDISIQEINSQLLKQNITAEGIHRKHTGNLPSTIILFKVQNENIVKKILHTKLHIGNSITNIRKYINITTIRCTNCQQLGHLGRVCRNTKRCVRCADTNCPPGACINGTLRRCVNCGKAHSSAYKNCEAVKNTNKYNMEKIKNKQTEEIIQTKHKQLQSQQTLNQKQIEEHKQDTTSLKENLNELQSELTQIKKSYAEATANKGTTHKQNENTTSQEMEKEVKDLKTLVHMMHANNIENNKIITTLQAENKQLNHKIDQLQQQNKRKPKPYIEDSTNLQQNINDTCITILKRITIPLITQTFIHKQTISNDKVMTKRIIITAKDLISKQTDILINPDDIDGTDSEDNTSSTESDTNTDTTGDEHENHKETTNSND